MSIIVYAPQGAGKNLHAESIRRHFKLSRVIEDGEHGVDLGKMNSQRSLDRIKALNALILTHRDLAVIATASRRVMSLDEALAAVRTGGQHV